MNIAVLTSLYPSRVRPFEGIFAERRWVGMLERGHRVRIIHPLPYAPLGPWGRRTWRDIHRMPRREIRSGIEIHRPRYVHVPAWPIWSARSFARSGVEEILRGDRPDVVLADYAWPAAAAAPLIASKRIPFLISGRGSDVLQVGEDARLTSHLGEFLNIAGHWCGVSSELVRAMDRLAGRPGCGSLVPNGVDLELFRPVARDEARRALGLATAGALVLVVGHLIERKDPVLALQCFATSGVEDGLLVFVGSGPLERRVRIEGRKHGLVRRLRIVGGQDPQTLAMWYGAADCVLLTSRREGRPNVVCEALACGRPVLATPVEGSREILDGMPGLLAPSREPEVLGRALRALLAAPPSPETLRNAVAGQTWSRSLERLEDCLNRVVG